MTSKTKVVFNWSSGKDSALALCRLLDDDAYRVSLLLTTLGDTYRRVSQHGVREELLDMQAERLGLPLKKVWLPPELTMEQYGAIMRTALTEIGDADAGIQTAAFGDIYLEELRRYREERLSERGFTSLFPLWQADTVELAEQFIERGFRAKVTCVNSSRLDRSFAGREYDRAFLDSLPGGVDPCGENGEFHTFVYDGPLFSRMIPVRTGAVVYRSIRQDGDKQESDDTGATTVSATASFRCGSHIDESNQAAAGLWYCDLHVD